MKFDNYSEQVVRRVAQQRSRRGFLGRLGMYLVGASALPLLPVSRASANTSQPSSAESDSKGNGYPGVASQVSTHPDEAGDPTSCDYWRYCGIGGTLCTCCGGSPSACPPGSEMSPLSWIGTCRNPVDGKDYIISYNDCCGKPRCTRCLCGPPNPDDKPAVRPQSSGGAYLWCLGTEQSTYTCSTAVVVGVALDQR